jgi:Na+-driven multidrug efflux pump
MKAGSQQPPRPPTPPQVELTRTATTPGSSATVTRPATPPPRAPNFNQEIRQTSGTMFITYTLQTMTILGQIYMLTKTDNSDEILTASGIFSQIQGLVVATSLSLLFMMYPKISGHAARSEDDNIGETFRQSLWLSAFGSLLFMGGQAIASLAIDGDTPTQSYNRDFLNTFLWSVFPNMAYTAYTNTFMSTGHERLTIGVTAARTTLELGLSYILILSFGLEVKGLGYATSLAAATSALVITGMMRANLQNINEQYTLLGHSGRDWLPSCKKMGSLLHGIPISLTIALELGAQLLFAVRASQVSGAPGLFSYNMGIQFSLITMRLIFAITRSPRILIQKHLQSDHPENIYIVQKRVQIFSLLFATAMFGGLLLTSIYSTVLQDTFLKQESGAQAFAEDVTALGAYAIPEIAFSMLFFSVREQYAASLTGIKKSAAILTSTILGMGPALLIAYYGFGKEQGIHGTIGSKVIGYSIGIGVLAHTWHKGAKEKVAERNVEITDARAAATATATA